MDFSNPYFTIILLGVLGLFALDTAAKLLNLKALRPQLPKDFADVYKEDEYGRSLVSSAGTGHFYTTDKNKRNMPEKM